MITLNYNAVCRYPHTFIKNERPAVIFSMKEYNNPKYIWKLYFSYLDDFKPEQIETGLDADVNEIAPSCHNGVITFSGYKQLVVYPNIYIKKENEPALFAEKLASWAFHQEKNVFSMQNNIFIENNAQYQMPVILLSHISPMPDGKMIVTGTRETTYNKWTKLSFIYDYLNNKILGQIKVNEYFPIYQWRNPSIYNNILVGETSTKEGLPILFYTENFEIVPIEYKDFEPLFVRKIGEIDATKILTRTDTGAYLKPLYKVQNGRYVLDKREYDLRLQWKKQVPEIVALIEKQQKCAQQANITAKRNVKRNGKLI